MAYINVEFFSECLKRCVSFKMLLPNDAPGQWSEPEQAVRQRKLKTLYLLHGYSNMSSEWLFQSNIAELSGKYGLCVVMPSGENSFYLDGEATGRKHATFIGEELPLYIQRTFGVSDKREDHFLGGLSMGGFGAIHTALQFPERFGKLFALSSALIAPEVMQMTPEAGNSVANYEYYRLMFGEPKLLEHGENNPEELVRRILAQNGSMPEMYLACGTEDFLLEANRRFAGFLQEQGVGHLYLESPGSHNFAFWNAYLEPAIRWLLDIETETSRG